MATRAFILDGERTVIVAPDGDNVYIAVADGERGAYIDAKVRVNELLAAIMSGDATITREVVDTCYGTTCSHRSVPDIDVITTLLEAIERTLAKTLNENMDLLDQDNVRMLEALRAHVTAALKVVKR